MKMYKKCTHTRTVESIGHSAYTLVSGLFSYGNSTYTLLTLNLALELLAQEKRIT